MRAGKGRNPDDLSDLPDGSHRVGLPDGRQVFAKIRRRAPPGFFAAEARGLAALRSTATLRVPNVFAVDDHLIALEDLGNGRAAAADWERAGRALARLHGFRAARFGFAAPGWCGDSVQDNTWDDDGLRFFAERRLLPQMHSAVDTGRLDRDDAGRIEVLCARLREWLPQRSPVLVHGDLWLGNLHACADGELALIDGGAVHYGWAEGDLAMLTLFGEPPAAFFTAYEAEAGVRADWRERAP
ncbi:MAG TPA: fructosamine kinase family protein, partial [Rudaea sp.]|nr:fructosamine kinase family protein [Rudaea sp.]